MVVQNGDKKSHFDGAGFQIAAKYGSEITSQIGKTMIQFNTLLAPQKRCKENKLLIELEHFTKYFLFLFCFSPLTCCSHWLRLHSVTVPG